ncbi:MAG: VWA domain-containing protein [Myxococcota bacterium]
MSLLAPFGLLLGLLSLPLLGLYFLKIRRKKVTVPSLLLWEELAKAERLAKPFDKFRRNLLLLLQLLILLLIVLAFARPALFGAGGNQRSMVLVLDTSASMAATDVSPSRLARAAERASAELNSLGPSDEATIVVAGPSTQVAVPFTRDKAALRAALGELKPAEARSHLREGVQLALALARSRPGVEVVVFSDGGHSSLADLPTGETPVGYRRVGTDSGNAGILALDLRASPSSELDRQIFVTVQRFHPTPADATIQVFLNDKLVGLRNAELGAKAESMVFDLPSGASGELRVSLDAKDDYLALDDTAWALVEPVRKRRITLVGGDRLTAKVLASDPRVDLVRRSASALTQTDIDRTDALFLTERVTLDLSSVDVAYLHPDAGGPTTFGGSSPRPSVLGWRRTHPLMRFVTMEGLAIKRTRTIDDNGGLMPIVDSTGGPLVLAGERSGARIVQLAFNPLETDLPLRVAWPVLVLNSVGWLTEQRAGIEHGHVVSAGDPWLRRVDDDVVPEQVTVTGPDGFEPRFGVADRLLRVQDTTRLGLYEVEVAGKRSRFAVNLQAPEESDLLPAQNLDVGVAAQASGAKVAAIGGGPTELWRYLLIFGLLILVVEWWVWNQRRHA